MYGPLNDYCPSCRELKLQVEKLKEKLTVSQNERQKAVQELKRIKWQAKQANQAR